MVDRIRIYCITLVIVIGFLINGCYKEEVDFPETYQAPVEFADTCNRVLGFNNIYAFTDTADKLLLYSIASNTLPSFNPIVEYDNYETISIDGNSLVSGENNDLGQVVVNQPYQVVASRGIDRDTFCLFFTTLPIMQIHTEKLIVDEPKVSSRIEIQSSRQDANYPQTELFQSYAGIEIRGASSRFRLKKSYGLEIWESRYGDDQIVSLLGMKPNEDWVLDALYLDKLKIRNKLSYEVWEKIGATPDYDQLDNCYPGLHSSYVELFVNNIYMGLYSISEKINETLFDFSAYQDEMGGVIYKAIHWAEGSTSFSTYNSPPTETRFWDGWEQIYPKDYVTWNSLDQLRRTIAVEDDETFKKEIASLIDLENVVDYYLFINMLRADDNQGKNTFFIRYDDQTPFFMLPWDLEAAWGISYLGYQIDPDVMMSNRLYRRLLELDVEDFEDRIEDKWSTYRKSVFHKDSLMSSIKLHCNLLESSGAIYRENVRWNAGIDMDLEYNYISEWIDARLKILDEYFD